MSDRPTSHQPGNDVYTILLMVATVMLIGSTIYLAMRSQELFGIWDPFTPV